MRRLRSTLAALAAVGFTTVAASIALADTTLLNVSYDPTRELYKAVDAAFAKQWKEQTGETVTIDQAPPVQQTSRHAPTALTSSSGSTKVEGIGPVMFGRNSNPHRRNPRSERAFRI